MGFAANSQRAGRPISGLPALCETGDSIQINPGHNLFLSNQSKYMQQREDHCYFQKELP
jgi:hypothetical protein